MNLHFTEIVICVIFSFSFLGDMNYVFLTFLSVTLFICNAWYVFGTNKDSPKCFGKKFWIT